MALPERSEVLKPLWMMTIMSDAVHVSIPISDTLAINRQSSNRPALVVLLGWVAARDAYLAKYVQEYQQLCPTATIVLVKARVAIMVQPSVAYKDVAPAITAINRALGPYPSTYATLHDQEVPVMHIHLFSNGGSCLLATLYQAYADSMPDNPILPLHTTIFDSTPSLLYDHTSIVSSIMAGLPPGFIGTMLHPLVQLLSLVFLVRIRLLGLPDPYAQWSAWHNDRSKVQEAKRAYIYSNIDPFVQQGDVEGHASDAERKGFNVRREFFLDSPHVMHAKTASERYLKIVREMWDVVEKARLS